MSEEEDEVAEANVEPLGLSGLEEDLPPDYFDELLERLDRRELGFDLLEMLAFGLIEATTRFTELLMALGLIIKPEEDADD